MGNDMPGEYTPNVHFSDLESLYLTKHNNRRVNILRRSQWPRGLRSVSAVARLLGLRVRIPPRAWMSVSCECCVLSGRGLCVGLITRPEESYQVWCVSSVIVKPRKMRRPRPPRCCRATQKNCKLAKYKNYCL
jgi:hypothetical protein